MSYACCDDTTQQLLLDGISLSLRNISLSEVNLTGGIKTLASGVITDYLVNDAINNNHVSVLVNSITGSGNLTIQGASVSEVNGITTPGDSEIITVDGTTNQHYQTDKKWWEITAILVGPGITAINYDVLSVGYSDLANTPHKLITYRLDIVAGGVNPDIALQIIKIQDDGAKKMSIVILENIGLDSGGPTQIIDNLRTGGADRTYTPTNPSLMVNGDTLVLKQTDFDTYFTLDENHINSNLNEGTIIHFTGAPSGNLSNVDFVTLRIGIRLL